MTASNRLNQVSTHGLVTGAGAGSFTVGANDLYSEAEYIPSYCTPTPVCPVDVSVSASGGGTVRVPKYLYATSMTTTSNTCELGTPYAGVAGSVHYQVLDQTGTQMAVAGMPPEEQLTVGGKVVQAYANFSTPVTTSASGLFDDVPVGACFSALPPAGQDVCQTVVQTFEIVYNNLTYQISTQTTQLQCDHGVKVSATGNPTSPSNKNHSYTLGTP